MYTTPVVVFTVAACVMWLAALYWATRLRTYYVFALVLATVYAGLSEFLAIRLGKYHYASFPLSVPGGTPSPTDPIVLFLRNVLKLPTGIGACQAPNWDVPFPVMALEAIILVAVFRICVLYLAEDTIPPGSSWIASHRRAFRSALVAGCIGGLMAVNLDAVLDPVVATSEWCGAPGQGGVSQGLTSINLWHWYTNEVHPGLWFGVPFANYTAWFAGAFSFTFILKMEDGEGGIIRSRYKDALLAVLAFVVSLVLLVVLQVVVKRRLDIFVIFGQERIAHLLNPAHANHPIAATPLWQFGVMGLVLATALLLVFWLGRFKAKPRLERVPVTLILVVFVFCLVALLFEPHAGVWAVWFVTTAAAAGFLLWPLTRGGREANRPAASAGHR